MVKLLLLLRESDRRRRENHRSSLLPLPLLLCRSGHSCGVPLLLLLHQVHPPVLLLRL